MTTEEKKDHSYFDELAWYHLLESLYHKVGTLENDEHLFFSKMFRYFSQDRLSDMLEFHKEECIKPKSQEMNELHTQFYRFLEQVVQEIRALERHWKINSNKLISHWMCYNRKVDE